MQGKLNLQIHFCRRLVTLRPDASVSTPTSTDISLGKLVLNASGPSIRARGIIRVGETHVI